jgi:protein TonB
MEKLRSYWNNKDKRKGLITTLIAHLVLFLVFLFFGLTYYEPKPEEGILINFGYADNGSGQTTENGSPTTTTEASAQTSQAEQQSPTQTQNPVQTQDVVDAPSIEAQEKSGNPDENKPKEEPKEEQKPSSELSDLLNQVQNTKNGGEGDGDEPGDQGDPTGDPNSPNRTGGGGGGGDGNYMLGSRRALEKPKPEYECGTDEGRVVVKIYVDRNGKVIRASAGVQIPGGKGSTTTSACLYAKAKAAALNTKWEADPGATAQQVGYIIYSFAKR